ncbi:hypothetical protein B0H14DRAFT_3449542 [Mycena olivaceomarginata]|nr:hypothetical protein B0H14DRAFT_3449542 [Mycena olivaceomarginata]
MVRVLVDAMKTKPPDFFRKAVRHLSIETLDAGGCSAEDAKALLHLCTRLTDLTIEYGLANPSLIPILKQTETAQAPHGLSLLPALTHLCLSSELPREEALRVWRNARGSSSLLVLWPFFDCRSVSCWRKLLTRTTSASSLVSTMTTGENGKRGHEDVTISGLEAMILWRVNEQERSKPPVIG